MKYENVEARLLHLIHHNWTEEAEKIIVGGKAKGFARLETGENVCVSSTQADCGADEQAADGLLL
jgi:hypothetical protein